MTGEWTPDAEAFFGMVQVVFMVAGPLIAALVVVAVVRRLLQAS